MDFNTLLTEILTNGIGGACAAAVLWFAWFRETKTLPQMTEKFAALQERMVSTFATANKESLATWLTLAREERAECERRHEENRERTDRLLLEHRDTQHLLAELAGQLGIKRAAEQGAAGKSSPGK